MDRRKRRAATTEKTGIDVLDRAAMSHAPAAGGCVVCPTRDARALVMVELPGGAAATLCGSHALMHIRSGAISRSVAELRANLGERRNHERRFPNDGDELGERLTAAFTRDQRNRDRRAS